MREFPPRHRTMSMAQIKQYKEARSGAELDEAVSAEPLGTLYISEQEVTALRQADLEKIAALREALEDTVLQAKGLKNNWCGEWFKCQCGRESSCGGNWTVSYYPKEGVKPEEFRCHICRAEQALQATAPGGKDENNE